MIDSKLKCNDKENAPVPECELAIYSENGSIRAVLLEDRRAVEYLKEAMPGEICRQDIFLGKVIRTVETLDAAFIDIGAAKHGLLPLSECAHKPSPGASLVVQVRQLKTGDKGHLLTTKCELPGPYAVYLPQAKPKRRSKLLALDEDKRDELFKHDLERLEKMWQDLLSQSAVGSVPRLLTTFGQVIDLALISFTGRGLKRIHVQEQDLYAQVFARMREMLPQFLQLLRLHVSESYSLSEFLGLTDIEKDLCRRCVHLKQGGNLTIDRTEAMTVIDVNSGGDTGGRQQEMRLRVNLQAAEEIVRQLRLRNIAGIVIVDFIGMGAEDQKILLDNMHRLLRRDRGHSRLLGFTRLGLLEMTRTPV